MLVSCHACVGEPRLCHHHPTFLCRQFALVDTEQSRLADGEWFAISPNRYQQQAFTILCLPSSPIDPEFALSSPSQANPPSAPCRHRQPRQRKPPLLYPPGFRHGANFKGPVVCSWACPGEPEERTPLSPPGRSKRTSISHEAGRAFSYSQVHPGRPRTWPADHAPRSWPVGSSGAPIFGGWMSVCLRRVSERASLHGRDAGWFFYFYYLFIFLSLLDRCT